MRHKLGLRKLNRTSAHRLAMLRNMMNSLLRHEAIKTTLPKAKELRRVVEPMITLAKEPTVANKRLAYIGSIKDDILNIEELALGLIGYLQEFYPAAIRERYNVEEELKPLDILTAVAKARGCLKKGEELDYEKASRLLLEEFRSGKLGKVTLEFPKGPEEV